MFDIEIDEKNKKENTGLLINPVFPIYISRSDGIRTHDLCVPNAALYQTEPRFELMNN